MASYQVMSLLIVVGGITVFGVSQHLYMHSNYLPVDAVVNNDDKQCYFFQDKGNVTLTSEKLDCDHAKTLKENHPYYRNQEIRGDATLNVTFISPADNQQHEADLKIDQTSKLFNKVGVNDSIKVLAHKTDPSSIAEDNWTN